MAPIRVGLIGLSSGTTQASASPGDSWAASAHLPYLVASPHYTITALLNSSVASAQAAIKRYNLPPSTKAYGTPEDLANDPDIDLVVVSVRVDRHYEVSMPCIRAGKNMYIEWPLGSNLAQAEEMAAAAKKSGIKMAVGLQSRASPYVQKVKQLVEGKAIGDLVSSQFTIETGWPGNVLPEAAGYLLKKGPGGSIFTIPFGHPADAALYALGGIDEFSAVLATRWPEVTLVKEDGTVDRKVVSENPDHIFLQGTLAKSGAPIAINARSGRPFKGAPIGIWRILGTKGEIQLLPQSPLGLTGGCEKLELYDYEKDSVENIQMEHSDAVKDLPMFARNIGEIYELYAKGGTVDQGIADFDEAVKMHQVIDKMEKSWENRQFSKLS